MTRNDLIMLIKFAKEFDIMHCAFIDVIRQLRYHGASAAYYFERQRNEHCDACTVDIDVNKECIVTYGTLIGCEQTDSGLEPYYEDYKQEKISLPELIEMIFAHRDYETNV